MASVPESRDVAFQAFRQFNSRPGPVVVSRSRLSERHGSTVFASDTVPDRIARMLASTRSVTVKELVETFELFQRLRKRLRSATIVDLCCGHGLLGVLFALLEREVRRVILTDRKKPDSYDKILAALDAEAPWVREKVTYTECPTTDWDHALALSGPSSVISAHACGELTDRSLDFAIARRIPIGVMPCCYPHRACPGPQTLATSLGPELAFDIHRTYRLETAGYRTYWSGIPRAITPKNRVLIGLPEAPNE